MNHEKREFRIVKRTAYWIEEATNVLAEDVADAMIIAVGSPSKCKWTERRVGVVEGVEQHWTTELWK